MKLLEKKMKNDCFWWYVGDEAKTILTKQSFWIFLCL